MLKHPVSLVIITLNEEKNIERCIRSVPIASDVVVLDSGSLDKTVDIARRLGARVLVEPWRGFARQKTRATAVALNDWVLSLDADEALSPEAVRELENLLNRDELAADAYSWPRLTFYLGQWLRQGGMYPDSQTRLFNRTKAKWLDSPVHEKVEAQKVEKLAGDIYHWSFESLADQIETMNKYTSLHSQEFTAEVRSFSGLKMVKGTLARFIDTYFYKKGYRDGTAGLVMAMMNAFSTFLQWAKMYEIKLKERMPHPDSTKKA